MCQFIASDDTFGSFSPPLSFIIVPNGGIVYIYKAYGIQDTELT
jgi:hypothetical protein